VFRYEKGLKNGKNRNKYFVVYFGENSTNTLGCSCVCSVRLWTLLLFLYCYGNCPSASIVRRAGFHKWMDI